MSTSRRRRFPGVVTRLLLWLLAVVCILLVAYIANVLAGLHSDAQYAGTLRVAGLRASVTISRDARDIPHIAASNEHDLFFAQGYAEAADRLFQMDIIRRYVNGTLAEVLGPAALPADERARLVPVSRVVAAQWRALSPQSRDILQAFSDGVNAAMAQQPLPVEFRLLLYKPKPWTPQDSLVVSFSTVLDLIDDWDDIIRRDRVIGSSHLPADTLYPVTDPAYDAPINGAPAAVPSIAPFSRNTQGEQARSSSDRIADASNNWAIGATHSRSGRALLANDPHLRVSIPGVWYLLEMRAPGFHAAGASLPGTPGIVLGHNDWIAWGATNGTVVTDVVYRDSIDRRSERRETFKVRLGGDVTQSYYSTRHGFVVKIEGHTAYAVDWNAVRIPRAPLETFAAIDRAQSITQAISALRTYPGPPQNFVFASVDGTAAYHLAGLVPDDPTWGTRVHGARDPIYPFVPFDALPQQGASRDAIVFTSNNRTYGGGYRYRLAAANFAAPYRAYRVRQLLRSKPRLSLDDFVAMQLDTYSIPESELARAALRAYDRSSKNLPAVAAFAARLRGWNGRFDPQSDGATAANALRRSAVALLDERVPHSKDYASSAGNADLMLLMRILRERPRGWIANPDAFFIEAMRRAAATTPALAWREGGSVNVVNPLSALGFTFLNGGVLPGDGDAFSVRVLSRPAHAQSFRAVWEPGNWDAGGIVIPSGESGRAGSPHYTDLRTQWVTGGGLVPLPFSSAAVRDASRNVLTLTPR